MPRSCLDITSQAWFSFMVEISILGPLEVRVHGREAPLGSPKQRALLALLALHANEVVSRDRLIDALWGERPPASSEQSLDTYVWRLRKSIGAERVVRRRTGYALRIDPDELDLNRFETLVEAAHEASTADDSATAARLLREALAYWRGPALADVLYEPFASGEVARLEERRLAVLGDAIDAELSAGTGPDLVPELELLVRQHPFNERFVGQLTLALYRAGRQSNALEALQGARRRLAEELGLDPRPQLRDLERRILSHDPSLALPGRSARRTRKRDPRRALVVLALAATAAVAGTGIVVATGGKPRSTIAAGGTAGVVALGLRPDGLDRAVAFPDAPTALATAAGSLWVADAADGTVRRLDLATGNEIDRIPVSGEPGDLASGAGAVWVMSTLGGTIKRIDPSTDTVTQTIPLGGANASAIAIGVGGLWVADATDDALIEIDPLSGSVRRTVSLDLSPSDVAVGAAAVWVASFERGVIEEFDMRTGRLVATLRVGRGPIALTADGHAVWVANNLDGTVTKVDVRTASVAATVAVESGPSAIAVAHGSLWVANTYSGTISRLDPLRNLVVDTLRISGRLTAIVAARDTLWIGAGPPANIHRGGTLHLVTAQRFRSLDPAFQNVSPFQLGRLLYDTLLTLDAAAGPAGLRLVPDLALAIPEPSRGGTAYVFRLRPGIRYSDGRRVRAGDFRRAVERLFRVGSPGTSYYTGLVGARSCSRRPLRCDLRDGIISDDKNDTVTFRLRAPDPGFLNKLTVLGFAIPVPPGTPDRDLGLHALPGTGPYRVESSTGIQLRLVRNPSFHEWSHAAQPDGNPDAIVWRVDRSPSAAANDVEHGSADWMLGLVLPQQLRGLQLRGPSQVRTYPSFAVDFISLNTKQPPFDDVRVRRALNYAIDRAQIARMYGGRAVATPICQPMAPGLPGYRRYCPYTAGDRNGNGWMAPDIARAERLVAASGTRGEKVDVWGTTDQGFVPKRLAPYIAGVLRSLGYRTHVRRAPSTTMTAGFRRNIQLSVDGDWLPDYPSPTSYFPDFFGCEGGRSHGYFCDPALDREMAQASAIELQNPARAAALWANIDRRLVDQAVWVPTVSPRASEILSKRIRHYEYNPIWGFIADQVWLR